SKGEYWESVEIPIRRKNGDVCTVLWNSANIYAEDGSTLLATIAQGQDITARKRAEETLRIANENTKTILEKAPIGIVVIGRDRKIKWVNNIALKMAGMESADIMLGKNCAEYLCPAQQKECPILDMRGQVDNSERILRRKDGKEIPIIKTVSEIKMAGEDVLLETFIDITELKQGEEDLKKSNQELKDAQAQLLQAGKLAAMGEMAAGVVHELSQPLLGIKGFTAAIHEDTKALFESETDFNIKIVNQIQSDLDVILQQTERMAKILNSVRNFARVSTTEKIPLDINQPIEEALLLFSEQLRVHNITIEKNLAPDLPEVMGNTSQLEQVFINLIANARAAMDAKGGRGQLTITTGGSANGIYIGVEDTGIGADAETVRMMFDPFFTTRITEEGTGLGLSIVQRIINEHNGTIDVKCQPGGGCKFIIHLPAAPDGGNGNG
ncbi:MAG: ATP-binding protein, partial [Bacteroidales bacterium]|nr:ATP-binding protein [Bacteroidales bacterium]